jgi:glycine/D-amino acid oxidase-like deaminating enzyme
MPAVDVAIIGGGIAGVSTAAFLAEGGLRVRLYERTGIAAGASGRNSGIVQHPFDPVLADLYRRSLTEYRALAAAATATFALAERPVGLLLVGHDLRAARILSREWAAAWPWTAPEVVEGRDLSRLEGALAPNLAACRLDIGFPVVPASATKAFARAARRNGAEIVLGSVARPASNDGRVVGVDVAGRLEPAGAVVVAAGPWTPEIIDPTGRWRPIRASWGVVAAVELPDPPRHGLEAIDITIEPGDTGDVPAKDEAVEFSLVPAIGSSALGSTFLLREPDPQAWVEALRRVGSGYVPDVAAAPLLGLRHCARPVSRDGRPLVGRAPWADDLWILAGHGPWGISTGPGSARLLCDQILGRVDASSLPAALDPGRFETPSV